MINGATAIVKSLEAENIKTIFGIPGAAICPFYDALIDSSINHILVRHEQNAGHMASGYARISKRPAVCVATSGPGALNLITAIATAYMDSIPLIAITGQVSSELLGRDVFQEADITGAVEPFIKHSFLVKNANDIPQIIKSAFYIASSGRQGPVIIDVPVDIQKDLIEFNYPKTINIRSYKPNVNGHMGQIKRVISAIKSSKKPLLCAGGGVISADCSNELLTFSKQANVPIVTTMMGLSSVNFSYENNLGMIGMYGSNQANTAMREADLIVLIGARVGDRAIMSPMGLSKDTSIIHIDIDPAEIGKNIETDIPLVGDIKNILNELIERTTYKKNGWIKRADVSYDDNKNVRKFLHEVMKKADNEAIVVADVGQNQIYTAQEYCVENGRFLTSGGMGTMGYGLPCAIGAKMAQPNKQVILVCGDGAFQMAFAELSTLKANNVDIKIVIVNNNSYGLVEEMQRKEYSRISQVELVGNPDFIKLANSYEIKAIRTNDINCIEEFLNTKGACLLEYCC